MAITLSSTKVEYIIAILATKEGIWSTLPFRDKYYRLGKGQNGNRTKQETSPLYPLETNIIVLEDVKMVNRTKQETSS